MLYLTKSGILQISIMAIVIMGKTLPKGARYAFFWRFKFDLFCLENINEIQTIIIKITFKKAPRFTIWVIMWLNRVSKHTIKPTVNVDAKAVPFLLFLVKNSGNNLLLDTVYIAWLVTEVNISILTIRANIAAKETA